MTDEQNPCVHTTFEDHFRGSLQEIRRRLSVYLPLLEEAGVRELEGEILDIGFGRGEWLEMLGAYGYRAVGVDLDEVVVEAGLQAGLEVSAADAFAALAGRADGSLAAVTAFHVIEHLDPSSLGLLMKEIHRVLTPGGVVVLETPNPENVTVGAAHFYIDPEHVRPVPPPLLDFLGRKAGFTLPWIARVNRAWLFAPLAEVSPAVPGALQINAVVYAVNGMLFAAPDYALVAQKAGGPEPELDVAAYVRVFGPQPLDLQPYRVLAAEEAVRASKAEKATVEARAQELAAEVARLETTVAGLEDDVESLGTHASEVQGIADITHAALEQSRHDFAVVGSSLSWRVTAPLRLTAKAARVVRSSGGEGQGGGSPKRLAKLAVGHPMRWILSQPRLGPAVDRRLAALPAVDHKVRVALYEVEMTRQRAATPAVPGVATDLLAEPPGVRQAVVDLEAALDSTEE